MSQDLICCIEGDFRAARLTICQTSGSCLQIKSSRRKLLGVAMCQRRVLPRGVHVEFVHSRCLFSFTPSCQQTVAGESAPCRERNHTEKIYDWTFVVFCYASLLICTEGGLIYCVLNIVLNIYSNAWFTCGIAAIMFLQGNVRFALLLCSQVSYVFSYSQRVILHWNDGASAKASAIRIGSVKIFIMSTQMHINAVRHRVVSAS